MEAHLEFCSLDELVGVADLLFFRVILSLYIRKHITVTMRRAS